MNRGLGVQKLLALFVVGWLLLSDPLRALLPGMAWGLFAAWALILLVLALLMERGGD